MLPTGYTSRKVSSHACPVRPIYEFSPGPDRAHNGWLGSYLSLKLQGTAVAPPVPAAKSADGAVKGEETRLRIKATVSVGSGNSGS